MTNTKEMIVVGPPGTGKTTYVSKQAIAAAQKFGSNKVMICSLTKAAAQEAAGRDMALGEGQIGTLHSIAYRALGSPTIVETDKDAIADWNSSHPQWKMSSTGSVDGDSQQPQGKAGYRGDDLMQSTGRLRQIMRKEELWASSERSFFKAWREWKNDNEIVDFTDLIETALADLAMAPGNPKVIFADEAQDLSTLEHNVITRWGRYTDHFICVGDPDQSIYGFRGSDPAAVDSRRLPDPQVRVLSQSYRVPVAVHQRAFDLINTVSDRAKVEYNPTDEQGLVRPLRTEIKRPVSVVRLVETEISEGRTVMILASCAYLLNATVAMLRKAGIPYHNPYAPSSQWNPLAGAGVSQAERLSAYLIPSDYNQDKRFWSVGEFKTAIKNIKAKGVFKHGMKSTIEAFDGGMEPEMLARAISDVFKPEVLTEFFKFSPDWFTKQHAAAHQNTLLYALNILKKQNYSMLTETPKVVVGTIHKVKGGEADTVILFPDLSKQFNEAYEKQGRYRDEITRMFYVGMTRAKQNLYLCTPSTPYQINV